MALNNNKVTCIIDDDEIYLFSVKKFIELNKFCDHVIQFRNGQEALDFFLQCRNNQQELPDVILLDINMPVMNGWEFIEQFKTIKQQLNKNIALYVVSSSVDRSDVEKARSLPAVHDYLVKPMTASQLQQIYQAAG